MEKHVDFMTFLVLVSALRQRFNTAEVHFDKCGPFFALSLSRMRFINAVQSDWPIFRLLYVARISSASGGFLELIC